MNDHQQRQMKLTLESIIEMNQKLSTQIKELQEIIQSLETKIYDLDMKIHYLKQSLDKIQGIESYH